MRRIAEWQQDSFALAALAPLGGHFLPWDSFSMRPTAILAIVNEVAAGRQSVLEFGSGNSTVFVARALAQMGGGRIASIDHDAKWGQRTQERIEREGLSEYASVSVAPLTDGWYDRAGLPEMGSIDLLVIDGPPGYSRRQARHPALGEIAERLTSQATVVLDDAQRPDERAAVSRWEDEFPVSFSPRRGGIAVGTWQPAVG